MSAAVLTVSDGVHAGRARGHERRHARGAPSRGRASTSFDASCRTSAGDRGALSTSSRDDDALLVLTTGGTGFAPRDVTPEATRAVVEREAPGLAEAIRADAIARTPHALLSRGIAGLRGSTLVVNLPGSPGGCRDGFAVIRPALRHGLELAAGDTATPHRQT